LSTVDKIEVEKFSKLASDWWNPNGKFKPLHLFNPARIKFIKEKLVDYKPDLIIAFGGQSDMICKMPEQITKNHNESKEVKTKLCGIYSPDSYDKTFAERWSEICRVGEKNGFDTVFILQPVPSFDKILSDQEFNNYFLRPEHTVYLNSLESFAQQTDNIEKHCAAARISEEFLITIWNHFTGTTFMLEIEEMKF